MKEISVIMVDDEGGEWSGLYVGGELECEGHNIYSQDWINLIRKYKHFKRIETLIVKDEWIEELGNLPHKLSDIPNEAIV